MVTVRVLCRDSNLCLERHTFISQLDQSQLPASGVIEVRGCWCCLVVWELWFYLTQGKWLVFCYVVCSQVVPLYIKTASVFYGRIVRTDDVFDSLASEMASYYDQKKPTAKEMLEGGLYAVQDGDTFHRSGSVNSGAAGLTVWVRACL